MIWKYSHHPQSHFIFNIFKPSSEASSTPDLLIARMELGVRTYAQFLNFRALFPVPITATLRNTYEPLKSQTFYLKISVVNLILFKIVYVLLD